MKIGFDVAQTCGDRAGCAWFADSLVKAMVAVAPEHHFFLYHQFGTLINESTTGGTEIVAPNVTPTFTDITSAEAARIWASPAELIIKTGAPDIVHANSFRAPKVPGAKLIFTIYDVSFWAVPHYTTEANRLTCQHGVLQALANADGLIFISQNAHDEFERILPGWLGKTQRPWVVVPLAQRPSEVILPTAFSHIESPYWLAVGSLEPRKNHHGLLDALALYCKKSLRPLKLKIAGGPGWKSEELHQRIAALTEKGVVQYLGYVPDEELPGLYAQAEALIFPSWYEGFGLPVLEAMAQGCPVICTNRTSLPEVGGNAVHYIDPTSPTAIADAMLRVEQDSIYRTHLSSRGRIRAAGFSWESTAKLTLAFYERVISSHPNP